MYGCKMETESKKKDRGYVQDGKFQNEIHCCIRCLLVYMFFGKNGFSAFVLWISDLNFAPHFR